MPFLTVLLALIAGAVAGFYVATAMAKKQLALKDQEVALEKRALQEREQYDQQLESRFKAVANEVLRTHSTDFKTDFDTKKKGIEETVEKLNTSINAFERQRAEQTGKLGESIKHVLSVGAKMEETAYSLKTVLSSASAVRGRWGEAVLKNLLEQSGLTQDIDFITQETIGADGELRPDVVINLPGGLRLAIDSKAGLEDFIRASEEKDETLKAERLAKFAQGLRGHIKDLSSKDYQTHLDRRIPYVVMFIPSEAAVRAVFEADANLYREAQEKKVMLASPATIMPLVLLIAHAWKQQKTVENASKLTGEISELAARLRTFVGHVAGIGASLTSATKKYNEAASSWDARVSPKIEQINTLGGNVQIEASIAHIEVEPRPPTKLLSRTDVDA